MNETSSAPSKNTVIEVARTDLPLSCPRPEDAVWNMHPRGYLRIDKTGEAVCPYCGDKYAWVD